MISVKTSRDPRSKIQNGYALYAGLFYGKLDSVVLQLLVFQLQWNMCNSTPRWSLRKQCYYESVLLGTVVISDQ